MDKPGTLTKIVFAMAAAVVALAGINAHSQNSTAIIQPEFAKIILQPEDQMVLFGSNATFTVTAANADDYQWLRNGNVLDNQTNGSLAITNCGINDVGYYQCYVYKDTEGVPTRDASLMVYTNSLDPQTGVDPIVVFGLALAGDGSQGSCPGHYAGYINYTKTEQQGWGWAPDTGNGNIIFTVTDTNRTDTKVQYYGEYGDNGCNQNSATVVNPPMSPVYRFTIYFTNNVPTNTYCVTLDGFLP
jgi:Immunoglobulin domain